MLPYLFVYNAKNLIPESEVKSGGVALYTRLIFYKFYPARINRKHRATLIIAIAAHVLFVYSRELRADETIQRGD